SSLVPAARPVIIFPLRRSPGHAPFGRQRALRRVLCPPPTGPPVVPASISGTRCCTGLVARAPAASLRAPATEPATHHAADQHPRLATSQALSRVSASAPPAETGGASWRSCLHRTPTLPPPSTPMRSRSRAGSTSRKATT